MFTRKYTTFCHPNCTSNRSKLGPHIRQDLKWCGVHRIPPSYEIAQYKPWVGISPALHPAKKNKTKLVPIASWLTNMLGRRGRLAQKFLTLLHWAILHIRMREASWLLGGGGLGLGGCMLTFHVTCSRCWCHAGVRVGGDVNVPCDLLTFVDATPRWGWGGGGMLTFHVTCSRCWCYATLGLGGGMLTFHVTCSLCWCYATQGLRWGGMLTFHVNSVKAYVDMSWTQSEWEKNSMQSVPVPEKTWLDRWHMEKIWKRYHTHFRHECDKRSEIQDEKTQRSTVRVQQCVQIFDKFIHVSMNKGNHVSQWTRRQMNWCHKKWYAA